jgi:hypothetical protein
VSIQGLRIQEAYVLRWLAKHEITAEQIVRGDAVWKTAGGLVPLTWEDIENFIAQKDPVVWAWLNLTESKSLEVDGVKAVTAGRPWNLFPIQQELARMRGDLLVSCGAEVGKSRDIILSVLWRSDVNPTGTSMIGGDSDQTLIPIWEELERQIEQNQMIGGGLVEEKCHIKPNRKKVFRNGSEIELRLAGYDGKNFRGGHFSDGIYADEAVKWKNYQQWSEFYRSGLPGSTARIYSTPDGDYSSVFYSMVVRAIPANGPAIEAKPKYVAPTVDGERRFRLFHISKKMLPEPFWSLKRAAILREQFGGEDTVGWITNVEGGWGSPSCSVFSMPLLRRCLKVIPEYRMVRVAIDRQNMTMSLAAARLADPVEGRPAEEMLARSADIPTILVSGVGKEIGRAITEFFPDVRAWTAPRLYCGADLGFLRDPSEFIFARVVGRIWTDLFRLHLRAAMYQEQADIVMQLDHASSHRVIYSFDNGSAGNALINLLTQDGYRECPECAVSVVFDERLSGRGFGESIDDFDIETGETIFNPDDKDPSGAMRPRRVSNKEFATRALERKMSAVELEIATDAGAGDQRLAGPQLMVNHTATGTNKKGERNFRGVDDHLVDARRQLALAITSEVRGDGFVSPRRSQMIEAGEKRFSVFAEAGPIASAFSVRGLGRRVFD